MLMSALNSCVNSPSVSKDLCYGSYLQLFEEGVAYAKEQEDNMIAHNLYACNHCLNYLTHDEQEICNSD